MNDTLEEADTFAELLGDFAAFVSTNRLPAPLGIAVLIGELGQLTLRVQVSTAQHPLWAEHLGNGRRQTSYPGLTQVESWGELINGQMVELFAYVDTNLQPVAS